MRGNSMKFIKSYCILLTLLEYPWTNDVENPLLKQTRFSSPFPNVKTMPDSYYEALWLVLA